MTPATTPDAVSNAHTKARRAIPLDQCAQGKDFRIVALAAQPRFGDQDQQVGLRLSELGFLPGCRLRVIGFGLLGRDPLAVQINGTKFAMRKAEAAKILVEAVEDAA